MEARENTNYSRIAEAICYLKSNLQTQPGWKEVAEKINLSPSHFQMLITDWAGTSPEKFLQYVTIQHTRRVLKENRSPAVETLFETGISGMGRMHHRFIKLENMTPDELKDSGKNLSVHYNVAETPFGKILSASTAKGICHIAFIDNEQEAIRQLQAKFPNAACRQTADPVQQNVLNIFSRDWNDLQPIKLHVKGTPFQIKVWETLLQIPVGHLCTYGSIAKKINLPNASRAIGSAIGDNPVAFLIPCHRVVQSTGALGGFRWGTVRKTAMIGWEAAQTSKYEVRLEEGSGIGD